MLIAPVATLALTATGWQPAVAPAAFERLLANPAGDRVCLVEIDAYAGGLPEQLGEVPLTAAPVAGTGFGGAPSGELTTLYYADRHWVGEPSDPDRPNAYYEGRVSQPWLAERALPVVPEQARRLTLGLGQVELIAADGALDDAIQARRAHGREVRILLGPPMPSAYADFRRLATGLAVDWEIDRARARLNVRDTGYRLDRALQSVQYEGSGDAEGGAELAGVTKPLAFGRVRNATLALVAPASLVYQIHDGPIQAVDAVYERGYALTPSGDDYADYATLVSAEIASGEYATALAAGLLRLGSSPDGLVTADVRGAAGPYESTLDALCLRVLRWAGLAETEIDAASFARLVPTGEAGLYLPAGDTLTVAEALDRLVGSVAGWWGPDRAGRIRAGVLLDPAGYAPGYTLDAYDLLAVDVLALPAAPRWRQRVGYRRNWTVQSGEDIPAAVSDDRRAEIAQPYWTTTVLESEVLLRHADALDPPPLESLLDAEADAWEVAVRLLAMHSVDRLLLSARVSRTALQLDLGEVVTVIWPRHGLAEGRRMAVVGVAEDLARDEYRLTLWG